VGFLVLLLVLALLLLVVVFLYRMVQLSGALNSCERISINRLLPKAEADFGKKHNTESARPNLSYAQVQTHLHVYMYFLYAHPGITYLGAQGLRVS
jgi:hypothetical protein